MKKFLMLILLISTMAFAMINIPKKRTYIDLGTEGHTYKIVEKSFLLVIKNAVAKEQKKLTPKKVKEMVVDQIRKQATGHTQLPLCQKSERSVEENYYILNQNIYNPAGRLFRKKGYKYIVHNKRPLDICFIDGTNKKELFNQIHFYDKVVKKLSGPNAKCIYMIANRNVLQLDKKFYPRMFYPTGRGYEKNFQVSCYPTLVHLQNDKRYKFELPIEDFQNSGGKK